jgi:integrase
MSLRRRQKVWWIDFRTPDRRRVRRSARTSNRVAAKELHDRLKAEAWRIHKLGEKPRRTWRDAVIRWVKEKAHKASIRDDQLRLQWIDRHLGRLHLDEITRDVIEAMTEAKLRDGVSNATVNRVLAVVRAILRRAVSEWEWIERAPRVRLLPEPKRRIRWLTRKEANRLLDALPAHLAEPARFALATGLRQGNVFGLKWDQVDLEHRTAWIHPDQAKARKAIAVPLNAEAMLVLRRQQGKHAEYCFTARKGEPLKYVHSRIWKTACERADIRNFRWHDLRHTWASWLVQEGTPLHVLQELGSWESPEMVRRYAHLSPEHLRAYVEKLAAPRPVDNVGTFWSQSREGGST